MHDCPRVKKILKYFINWGKSTNLLNYHWLPSCSSGSLLASLPFVLMGLWPSSPEHQLCSFALPPPPPLDLSPHHHHHHHGGCKVDDHDHDHDHGDDGKHCHHLLLWQADTNCKASSQAVLIQNYYHHRPAVLQHSTPFHPDIQHFIQRGRGL